jgi:glycosyltransferase involved in cell wall biosynthesis
MSGDLSVIMPCHDAEPWIGDAIRSVLEHADGLLELIVVDDGSTDESAAIAESLGGPVRVLRQAQRGPAAARNAGIAAARGTLVGFLDADDLWVAGRPDPRRAVLADPEVDVVVGRVQPIVGEPPQPIRGPMGGVQLGAMLIRRDVLERHGGMDEGIVYGEDLDWILRLRDAGVRLASIDAVTTHYRLRLGSLTRDREATRDGMVRALHASLRRRGIT